MLQSLHGAAKKWVGLLLFTMLMFSFVAWGIADVFSNVSSNKDVVTVGDIKVSGQQLQNEVRREISYIRQMTGRTFSMKEAADFGVIGRTVQSLIDRALLEQEANRLGMRVTDDIILRAIRDIPSFKNPDGSFNAEMFRAALANNGLTEKGFILDQRISLAREQLVQSITAAAKVPNILERALTAAQAEERTVETYQVKFAGQSVPATTDDATLKNYIDSHPAEFTRPEYRKVSFLRLSVNDLAGDVSVSDAELQQAYESQKDSFNTPERRTISQVVISDKAQADAIAAAAKGKGLDDAAKANGQTTTELKDMAKAELPEELQNAAFSLTAKAVSAPVESPLGWHVLQVTSIKPGHSQSFAEAKAKLEQDIRVQKASDLIVKQSQSLDDQLASGAELSEIAKDMNLVLEQVPSIDAQGKDEKGNKVGVPAEALAAAFRLSEGGQSELISTQAEDYYVVKVDGVTPSAVRPLAEVKAQALTAWKRAQAEAAARKQADAIIAALKEGKPFDAVASQFKIESSLEKNLSRKGTPPKYLPENILQPLFDLKKGEVTQAQNKDAIVIARLRDIAHPVSLADAKPDPGLSEKLQQMQTSDMFRAYADSLKARYPVKIDEKQIGKLFAENDQEQ